MHEIILIFDLLVLMNLSTTNTYCNFFYFLSIRFVEECLLRTITSIAVRPKASLGQELNQVKNCFKSKLL